jgi:hypothetical protein
MKAKSVKSSSYIQVLLDKYIYHVVINKSYKQSFIANPNNQMTDTVNLNLA